MKWGWVLVTLYIGPIGAALYVLSCKEPSPGTHEELVAPLWKQSLGSTIHCVAGDATGIIVASVVTTTAGLPMWGDTIVEYVFGFAFGSPDLPGPLHAGHAGWKLRTSGVLDGRGGMAVHELRHGRA